MDRLEWRSGDAEDPAELLAAFLAEHGLAGPLTAGEPDDAATSVALLLGAGGCARLAGLPQGPPSPVPAVPELVAVALRPGGDPVPLGARTPPGRWRTTWTDAEHAGAVRTVQDAIARGEVYQANVVGHRSAPHTGDPVALAAAVAGLPGAVYGGVLGGDGWAVGCASPEQLVRTGGAGHHRPGEGDRAGRAGQRRRLLASLKDRAEHVMIVDLERNDLARVAVTGSVQVERLYELVEWAGLWQAGSTVAARLREDVTALDLLRALAPGGSVTGAPKRAALSLLAGLEPVGRGPAMGAFGTVSRGGVDLGLTIRTVAVDEDAVHLWAGGGITWGSDPDDEVAEAHAKAAPVVRALG